MALPDPLTIPDVLLCPPRFYFDYTETGARSRTAGGHTSFQERVGGSLFVMRLTSKPLLESEFNVADAFVHGARGGSKKFRAYDLRRPWPFAYGPGVLSLTRSGGGTFDGTATLTAAGGSTVSLSGLPANYIVTPRDYVSFSWLGAQILVKALEGAAASAGGILTNLTIGPWQRSGGTVPVTATLVRAWCLMTMDKDSYRPERTSRDPVSIEAIQSIVP